VITAISAAISECEHNAADGKKMRKTLWAACNWVSGGVAQSVKAPLWGPGGCGTRSLLAIHPIAFSRSPSEFPEVPLKYFR